jgi:hypothetical protein
MAHEKEKNKMGIYVRVTERSLPGLLERLEKETSVRWPSDRKPTARMSKSQQIKHIFFGTKGHDSLSYSNGLKRLTKGHTRAPNHTAFVREVAKACPPEGVPQVTNFCAGCKDRQDKIDALTTQDAKLAEAETLEAAKPTSPRVPSRIGAPCEVWDRDDEGRRVWYYMDKDVNGEPMFIPYSNSVVNAGVRFNNWRELAPVEGGEG